MTRRIVSILAITLLTMLAPDVVQADIAISLSADGATNADVSNTGVHIVSFYISETGGADQSLLAAVPLFSITGGLVQTPAGVISDPGSTGTSGFFGAGNLSVSELLNEPLGNPSTNFLVNQEFINPQTVPDAPNRALWFTLNLDTTGLADGVYQIEFDDAANSFFDSTGAPIAVNNNLTFTVAAVPEPTGLGLLGLTGVAVLLRRRRSSR